MNPNPNPNMPLMGAGYMPYVYAVGRFQTYGTLKYLHPRNRRPSSIETSGKQLSVYDFSSDRPLWSESQEHGMNYRVQTVEQVIASGYFAVPHSDPETALISDRRYVAGLGLDDLIGQIRHRYTLYQQNMEELTYAVCEANNAVHRQVADQGQPADNLQQDGTQKQLQKIYEQQREERVNLWRDVSRLRLVLPENLQSYLSAYRKLSILTPESSDLPENDASNHGGDE